MSSSRDPSIITEVKPDWMARRHTAGEAPWSWCTQIGRSGYASTAACSRWRRNGSPAYLRAPAEICTMTGLAVAWAAARIAWSCSRLLTLKAGTP